MFNHKAHIGITGPIYLSSLNLKYKGNRTHWPKGMGGTPVNHLINVLLDLGYKISVFSSSPEIEVGQSWEWHEDNIALYIGPYRKRARHRICDFFKKERDFIKKAILKAKPDFIHAHWQYEWAWGAIDSKIPTIVTCHDSPIKVLKAQPDFYRVFRLFMAVIVLNKANKLTTVSPYCAKGLKLLTSKKIEIIPNFEPDFVFSFYDTKKRLNTDVKIVMINNGFSLLKNAGVGIQSFVEYRKIYPNAELHLYGKSFAYGQEAYNWCKENSELKNIYFHGLLSFNDLMKELSTKDIFLHTSKEESFGMVLVEAMAMGIPVVAGENTGGPDWILENGGGFLVDIKDSGSIKEALIKLTKLGTYQTESLRARESSFDRFSSERVITQYLETYRLLDKKNQNNESNTHT